MSRWKRLSSERMIATTLVFFASSIGALGGCDDAPLAPGDGGAGGNGGGGGAECMPQDDGNDCTTDSCDANGMQVHTPLPAGDACTSKDGSQCDGNGACVQCLAPSDCPGTDDACQTRTCTMGACAFDYAPKDTALPTQTAGDCKLKVCDGNGAQIDNNDDTDKPDDSNACTDDVCTAGSPSNPELAQGTNCGTDLVCNDMGQCVGCNTGFDCPEADDECSTRTCTAGVCGVNFTAKDTPVNAQTDNNCLQHVCDGNGNFVDITDDTDFPVDDGNACTSETCIAGMPSHPDMANGTGCSDGDLCTPMDTCQMGTCTAGTAITCTASDQCHVVGTCDSATGMCSNPAATNGTMCNDGNLCTLTDLCLGGTCLGGSPVGCTASDACHIAGTCDSATGMCSNPAAIDGTTCNDGNGCTQTDGCVAGTCTGSNPVICMASDACHIAGTCNSTTGTCSTSNAPDGTFCTSGLNTGMCTMGTCVACGDGIITSPETCDDGNTTAGDGCNATCGAETGWTCTGAPSMCMPICGDGVIRAGEQCDDKNTTSGDGCSSTCQLDITCAAGEVPVIVTNSTATPIPDTVAAGANGGIVSAINIAQTGVVRKVISTINIAHNNTAHVDVFLVAPYGVQRELATDVGTAANFTATTFSDAAATSITTGVAPYTGTFKPEQTISDAAGFANQTATGDWALRVSDDTTGTTGTLNSWSIALCIDPSVPNVCGNGYVEPNEQCDDSNANSGDGCANCQLEFACAANETLVVQQSTNGPLFIPDNSTTGVQSTINISNTGVVGKAIVVLNSITHTFDADIEATLISPTGTNLDITSDNGSTGDDYLSTILNDAATTAVTAGVSPFRGQFRPETAFSGILGQQTNGAWTLKVADDANADIGVLHTWTLGLCVAPPPVCGNGTVELGEGCDDNGTNPGDGCSMTCTVESGYTCTGTAPSTCTLNCGNGTIQVGEGCDDGDTDSGDGCSSTCTLEADYVCTSVPSMCSMYETNCNDTVDNDGDGNADDADSDCVLPAYFPGCAAGETLRVYKSFDTPLAIPDNTPAGTTSSVYVVDAIGNISSAATLLNITHTFDADVDITLISPANASFDLTSDNGSTGDNYTNTILASGCGVVTAGVAPFSACFAPEASLAPLATTSAQGVWKLKVVDDASALAGTLNNWALVLCIAP